MYQGPCDVRHLTGNREKLDPRKKDKLQHRKNEQETWIVSDLGVRGGKSVHKAVLTHVDATVHTTSVTPRAPLC